MKENISKPETTTASATETVTEGSSFEVIKPDYFYSSPLPRYVDVTDQYDGDPIRMRTGPAKDGTEKILEIPDGNYVYICGGLADRDDCIAWHDRSQKRIGCRCVRSVMTHF